MTDTDPMQALYRLASRISEICEAEGVKLFRFAAVPGDEPHLELMFTLNPDWHKPDEFDDMLAGIEEATRKAEIESRAEEARKGLVDLSEQLRNPKDGIL